MMSAAHTAQEKQAEIFRTSWSLYDAITEKNYMFHREIYSCVAVHLQDRQAEGGYSILDLGCGNARFMAPCLKASPPDLYVGVDLSAAALEEAGNHLGGLTGISFLQREMLGFLEQSESRFDVIFSGFAVHHLDPGEKQRLFRSVARCLAPGGSFLLADVARQESETREEYLQGYIAFMRKEWTGISGEQLEEAISHVLSFDFPETLSRLNTLGKEEGMTRVSLLARHAQHHLLKYSKEPSSSDCGR